MDNRTIGFMNFENSTSLLNSAYTTLFLVPIFIEFGGVLVDLLKTMDF